MASSPPPSPMERPQRPTSAMIRPPRSSSRMSVSSKQGGSRASDEDAKTSVKVAVRIRPPLKPTDPGFELIPQRFQRSMVQAQSPTSLTVDSPQGRKLFVFDKVWGEDEQQGEVWDYISESVSTFIQGYNVSVLAYGQSGAGKSFTMGTSGPAEQGNARLMGVIPRAAKALFEKLGGPPGLGRNGSGIRTPTRYSTNSIHTLQSLAKAASDKTWQMRATYVEIYNEQLRDLLVPEDIPLHERAAVAIREDKGRIFLTGLHQVNINSTDDLLSALNFGSTIRQTDATAINAKSSRSHAVFSINLVQRKNKQTSVQDKRMSVPLEAMTGTDSWITVDSKLHFVDLAGSERLKNTGASGDRVKEGISINAGLASLGKVISQLSSRQAGSHVSYRDSKLTRMLQDSLGGNAITYMIACVTPAEFHLSETLNTVQYAQRARAIQSKPQIQQVSDDADKQAVIDRLRAEVSFLRDQIRNAEHGGRSGSILQERPERPNDREIEMHNHLLDVQENYSALSQRHAKLISEIAKARDTNPEDTPTLNGAAGDSAVERLKRSNSFAEAVEQVVLEYEKTIQSLEISLSNTRSSLSNTESTLLERETKCTYVETVNQQLQTRIQKLVDRESSTEQYLHDLEARFDGRSSGDEKKSAAMINLHKEIARLRENEATCEEYISTLEERLAESDQDMELMQREIGRLEHVVERQRSLGKLDNLLYELDHIQSRDEAAGGINLPNGIVATKKPRTLNKVTFSTALRDAMDTPIPESDEEDGERPPVMSPHTPNRRELEMNAQSSAQSKLMAEKLETVNQELFDLKVEHEVTINEFDLLSAKYEEALRTLATLQDVANTSRRSAVVPSAPVPFLEDARVNELKNAEQSSSSRSLSSELSLAGESSAILEPSEATTPVTPVKESQHFGEPELSRDQGLSREMERLKILHSKREQNMSLLQEKYERLQEEHLDTLDLVEELKAEIQKARRSAPTSPASPVIIRKSSQNVLTIDRAHRSLASLGNIAAENFEGKPDTMQNFELNLTTVMHEIHQRSERVQVLEAEVSNMKKEMEMKMTIITGLTRERSSLTGSSPMDMSMISSMRDQLVQSENQIKLMHEKFGVREQDLIDEIETLKDSLVSHQQNRRTNVSGYFPATPAADANTAKDISSETASHDQDEQVSKLKGDLSQWESRHQAAVQSMQASEKKLLATVAELENTLANVESMRERKTAELETKANSLSAAAASFELERERQASTISNLTREINTHKATIETHVEKTQELEQAHANAQREIEEAHHFRLATQKSLDGHRNQISLLEEQITEHQSAVEFHKHGLKSLHDSQSREIDEARSLSLKQAEVDAEARLAELSNQHSQEINALHDKTSALERQIQEYMIASNDCQLKLSEREALIEQLRQDKEAYLTSIRAADDLKEAHVNLTNAERARSAAEASLAKAQTQIEELKWAKSQLINELADLREKEQRASRLVEELEGQLSSTFEDSRAATGRLSLIQNTREQELQEARAATAKAQEEIEVLNHRLEQFESQRSNLGYTDSLQQQDRTNSMSIIRKSTSVGNLPSPPPAIPLPPLPTNMSNVSATAPMTNGLHSPTDAHHGNKDMYSAQQLEDQEARIRTIEKHLFAEKQLTATLEEALVDLETQGNRVKADADAWKKKARAFDDELQTLRKERTNNRFSLQAVEEERSARREAEAAKAHLEERMAALSKKKKKSSLNCF